MSVYPDTLFFQSTFVPEDSDQWVEVRQPATVGSWVRYTCPADGVRSQLEFQAAAAAWWQANFGGVWSWPVIPPTGGQASLLFTGAAIDIRWGSSHIRNWVGYSGDSYNTTTYLAGGPGQGCFYPTEPASEDEPLLEPVVQTAWVTDDEVLAVSPAPPIRRRTIRLLFDLRSGWSAWQKFFAWVRDYAAAYATHALCETEDASYEDVHLVVLDDRQKWLDPSPIDGDWAWVEVDLNFTERDDL